MAQIRYPGSKHRIRDRIIGSFPYDIKLELWSASRKWRYIEPFFGSGAIGFSILDKLPITSTAVLADIDLGIVSLWKAVQEAPDELIGKIVNFRPSVAAYEDFKRTDGDKTLDPVELGFRKLALHQMSFSGLGAKSGGPIGGADQSNPQYNINCRWKPDIQVTRVLSRHAILRRCTALITCKDFQNVLADARETDFIYCDPPYVSAGPGLYKFPFTEADHIRLSQCLDRIPCRWAVSYDNHPMIRKLYARRIIVDVDITYSLANNSEARRKNHEILITNFQ